MIIVTGAAGFIGSRLIEKLNTENFKAVIGVDDFSSALKKENFQNLELLGKVDRKHFISWIDQNQKEIEFIFHLGARTDTAEFNREILFSLNTHYSQDVWNKCVEYQIPLIYASSAATYGLGEFGYNDDESLIPRLQPLNPYGESKNAFDIWALNQREKPFFWAGLKFFNVYGPYENHKGRMASVVWHAFHQVQQTGKIKLFKSHRHEFRDGEQKRDFIYVNDVTEVCYYLMHHRKNSGIYNVGTGNARSFLDLARSVFHAMDIPEKIEFIDTPEDIRDKYQYYTQAEMSKLHSIGYHQSFTSLEDGVSRYVRKYLLTKPD